MAYIVMACIVMAYILMAYIVMACIVMACIVMAHGGPYTHTGNGYFCDWFAFVFAFLAAQRGLSGFADAAAQVKSLADTVAFFSQYLGARRRRTPRSPADPKVPEDASGRDLSDATLRFDLAPGVRRRHAPKSC